MSKWMLIVFSSLLLTQTAFAQLERDIFSCQSQVSGFEQFKITQILEEGDLDPQYQMRVTKADLTIEVWNQHEKAQLTNETPAFTSQFKTKRVPPPPPPLPEPTPENPNPQPPPQPEEGDDLAPTRYAYVSINLNGIGSLSIRGDLAPIFCQKLF